MKCPACYNELTSQPVGGITVDICEGGCGGVWLDAFELNQIGKSEASSTELLLQIATDPTLRIDPTRKRACPRCPEVKLKRRFFSPKRRVEIDECPGCGGIWLDAGELSRIQEELAESKPKAGVATSQPQLSMEIIRRLYRFRMEERGES